MALPSLQTLIGIVFASAFGCAHRAVSPDPMDDQVLPEAIAAAGSSQRSIWYPAVEQLGILASKGRERRSVIWEKAHVNSIGMKFVNVAPGRFIMGPDSTRVSRDVAHEVEISQGFWVSNTEVTVQQFQRIRPDYQPDTRIAPHQDCPATGISWEQARQFCQELSEREGERYRLPTEAEWEMACRAGTTALYGFGNDSSQLNRFAWWHQPTGPSSRVALLEPNEWGLYDMHGNALEWVSDWYQDFAPPTERKELGDGKSMDSEQAIVFWTELLGQTYYQRCASQGCVLDPKGPEQGSTHVLRGGAWPATVPQACSSVARMPLPVFDRSPYDPRNSIGVRQTLGFRVVREEE